MLQHMPASVKQLDWMELINDVVISLGKDLVDIVHLYGKKAYVFYDDSLDRAGAIWRKVS